MKGYSGADLHMLVLLEDCFLFRVHGAGKSFFLPERNWKDGTTGKSWLRDRSGREADLYKFRREQLPSRRRGGKLSRLYFFPAIPTHKHMSFRSRRAARAG